MSVNWNNLTNNWVEENGSLKANFPVRQAQYSRTSGLRTRNQPTDTKDFVAVVNPKNGAFDVYDTDIFGRRTIVYTYNPSDGSREIHDETLFRRSFKGTYGVDQYNTLNKRIKQQTLDNLERHKSQGTVEGDLRDIGQTTGYQSYANTANLPPAENPPGGDNPDPNSPVTSPESPAQANPAQLSSAVGQAAGKTREDFPFNLTYPIDLAKQSQDFLKIEMIKYVPRGFSPGPGGGFAISPGRPTTGATIGSVFLPIATASDTNAVQFGSENMNALEAEAALIAMTTMNEGGEGLLKTATSLADRIKTNSSDVRVALAAFFTGAATGTGQQIIQRAAGAVFNPNMELLFSGPSLRPFTFSYKLTARSQPESDRIIKIIRFFKQGMAPQRTPSNLFLKAPHTFKLAYQQKGGDHKFLNKFKECALQSMNVNYAPEGTYATFSDGKMVSYSITLQFQELEPVFNDDYGNAEIGGDNDADTQIGF